MKFEIGAMSIGDMLDRGLKLLWARFGAFYAITFIMLLPILIFELLIPDLVIPDIPLQPRDPNDQEQVLKYLQEMLIIMGQTLLLAILQLILVLLATAVTLHVTVGEYIDRRVGVGEAFGHLLRRFGALLGSSILAWLVVALSFLLCILPGIVLAVVGGPFGAFLTLVLIILAVVVGFMVAIWYLFVPQVVVLEGAAGVGALARSKELTEGFRWRIFGMMLLLFLIRIGLLIVSSLLSMLIPPAKQILAGNVLRQEIIPTNYVIYVVLVFMLDVVVQSYATVCWTLFYLDLRIRKEGFDLELMAQQGQGPPAGLPGMQAGTVDGNPPDYPGPDHRDLF